MYLFSWEQDLSLQYCKSHRFWITFSWKLAHEFVPNDVQYFNLVTRVVCVEGNNPELIWTMNLQGTPGKSVVFEWNLVYFCLRFSNVEHKQPRVLCEMPTRFGAVFLPLIQKPWLFFFSIDLFFVIHTNMFYQIISLLN